MDVKALNKELKLRHRTVLECLRRGQTLMFGLTTIKPARLIGGGLLEREVSRDTMATLIRLNMVAAVPTTTGAPEEVYKLADAAKQLLDTSNCKDDHPYAQPGFGADCPFCTVGKDADSYGDAAAAAVQELVAQYRNLDGTNVKVDATLVAGDIGEVIIRLQRLYRQVLRETPIGKRV